MKNKIIKCSMFLNFIFLAGLVTYGILKYFNENKFSEENKLYENYQVSQSRCTNNVLMLSGTGKTVNVEFHSGQFYKFTMNNNVALCAESGKHATSNIRYTNRGEGTNVHVGKALSYAESNSTDESRLAAQVVAWTGRIDARDIESAFVSAGYSTENVQTYATGISRAQFIKYCEYYYSNEYQKIYSKCIPDEEEDCDPPAGKCKKYSVSVSGSIPYCKDNSPSFSNFKELVSEEYGGFTTTNDKRYSKYGYKEQNINDYCKLYCLEEANMLLPSGYKEPFNIGSIKLVWPQSEKNHVSEIYSNFKLSIKGRKICHVVFSKAGYCSYEDWLNDSNNEYFKNKKTVEENKNDKKKLPKGNNYKDKTTVKITNEHARFSQCSDTWTDYSECAINYINSNRDFNSPSVIAGYASQAKTAAINTCKTGTHVESCTKGTKGCVCNGNNCLKSVSNDANWCEGNFTLYDPEGYYSYWSSEANNMIEVAMRSFINYNRAYFKAKKVLHKLYNCENKEISNPDEIYKNVTTSVELFNNDDEYEKTYSLKHNDIVVTCEECNGSTHRFKEKSLITQVSDLIDKNTLKSNIVTMEDNKIIKLKTNVVNFYLPDVPNANFKYLNTNNNELSVLKPSSDNYIKIPYNFLPISMKAKTNKKYDLILKNIKFGSRNSELYKFLGNEKYTCHYKVTSVPCTDCQCYCPPDSLHPDLELKVTNGKTCATVQQENYDKCYDKTILDMCPNDNDYNSTANKNFRSCINGGHSESYCINQHCYDKIACDEFGTKQTEMTNCMDGSNDPEKYYDCFVQYCQSCPYGTCTCPSNTDNKGKVITTCISEAKEKYNYDDNEAKNYCINKECYNYQCPSGTNNGMDITSCVQLYVKQSGKSFASSRNILNNIIEAAKDYCIDTICPYDGLKIIYRTIKLENPFPSYNADKTKISGLDVGTYNLNVSGRYPGSNWDSKLLVYNKIINNRGIQFKSVELLNSSLSSSSSMVGTTIYQTRKPLYTFNLTPAIINKIRNYNNNNNSYDDFNLDCKYVNSKSSRHSVACVSKFIHGDTIGDVGLQAPSSTCSGVGNVGNNFYSCVNTANP